MNTSKVVRNRITIFGFILIFVLNGFLFLKESKIKKEEKDLELTLKIIEKKVKINQPITAELKFSSRKEKFRLYKHPVEGIASAIGIFLNFNILYPDGTILKKWCHEYDVHVGGLELLYPCERIDISPGSPYIERIIIYPGRKFFGLWPDDGMVIIRASYFYKHKKRWKYGEDLWEGKVESNLAEVEIVY